MHDRIEGPAALVDAAQYSRGHLAEIGEIDLDAAADGIVEALLVDIGDIVAMRHQIAQHGAPQLAAATVTRTFAM